MPSQMPQKARSGFIPGGCPGLWNVAETMLVGQQLANNTFLLTASPSLNRIDLSVFR